MTESTFLTRTNHATGKREAFPVPVSMRDAGLWGGVRLERWSTRFSGSALVELSTLHSHCLALVEGSPSNGEVRFEDERAQKFECSAGDLVLLPAAMMYSCSTTFAAGSLSSSINLLLEPGLMRSVSDRLSDANLDLRPMFPFRDAFIKSALLALARDMEHHHPGGAIYGEAIANAVALHLVQTYGHPGPKRCEARDLDAAAVQHLKEYIHANLSERVTLNDLALIAGVPPHCFPKAFKSAFGVPPHRYLIEARVQAAKALLKIRKTALADIALQAGFSSQGHFSMVFKKATGISPSTYRTTLTE